MLVGWVVGTAGWGGRVAVRAAEAVTDADALGTVAVAATLAGGGVIVAAVVAASAFSLAATGSADSAVGSASRPGSFSPAFVNAIIPPLSLGSVRLDLAFLVLILVVYFLQSVVARL